MTDYEGFLLKEILYECDKIRNKSPKDHASDTAWERIQEIVKRLTEKRDDKQ